MSRMGDWAADRSLIDQVARETARQTESIILEQLGELVTKGLLELETGPIQLVQDHTRPGSQFQVCQHVKLVLKDKEYIQKLEKEITYLREVIGNLRRAASDVLKEGPGL